MFPPHTAGQTRPRPSSRELSGSPSLPDQKKLRLDTTDALDLEKLIPITLLSTSSTGREAITGGGVGIEVDDLKEDTTLPAASGSKKTPKKGKAKKRRLPPSPEPGTSEDVTWHEVKAALGHETVERIVAEKKDWEAPVNFGDELELEVIDITSNGDSISLLPAPHPPWAIIVPFTLPGERIRARVHRNLRLHSLADLISVEQPNEAMRDMSLVKCQYFGRCGGCQYQMLSYDTQLRLKKKVVEKAYVTFSGLPTDDRPAVLPTIPSPKQYEYRTKITPHFEAVPKGKVAGKDWELRIGFDAKGRRQVMDIEECSIATPILNKALGPARENVKATIHTFKRGATLLLRDSLLIPEPGTTLDESASTAPSDKEAHICITTHKETVRERVGSLLFEFPSSSFFQNNNSILIPLLDYVRDAIFPPNGTASITKPTHLVDTYCGSGLFSIALSSHFDHIAGIEIDAQAIRSAKHNLALNNLPVEKHAFHAGKSEDIFLSVLGKSSVPFPADRTVVIIDPPRKGCDESFINQVVRFRPATLVYVSCNVHTQARDVGMIVKKTENDGEGKRYKIRSLRGFDLFPQTAHVESVAVLSLE